MPCACRKYSDIARLEIEGAPIRAAESHLPAASRDTEDFMDA